MLMANTLVQRGQCVNYVWDGLGTLPKRARKDFRALWSSLIHVTGNCNNGRVAT